MDHGLTMGGSQMSRVGDGQRTQHIYWKVHASVRVGTLDRLIVTQERTLNVVRIRCVQFCIA